jgi:hypothetical protein
MAVRYSLIKDASYASHGRDPGGSYFVADVCMHNPENINNSECITEKAGYCIVLLLQQY